MLNISDLISSFYTLCFPFFSASHLLRGASACSARAALPGNEDDSEWHTEVVKLFDHTTAAANAGGLLNRAQLLSPSLSRRRVNFGIYYWADTRV